MMCLNNCLFLAIIVYSLLITGVSNVVAYLHLQASIKAHFLINVLSMQNFVNVLLKC